ncbi:MAG: beta-lactamase family protein [Lentisphaerae bacterium]|nr:beta-lactamase family protein [Lentisphaerota bacterium]
MNKNWDSLQAELQQILDEEVASKNECACQLCIIDHGNIVINIAAGTISADSAERCTTSHLFPFFSSGKPFLAAIAWKFVERGLITFDTPVAKFWKEFNTPDKAGITIEHLLSHRGGLYLLPPGKPDISDWDEVCRQLAAMTPRNLPGEKCHYHPLTFGWLLGHTLELIAGVPLHQLMLDEVITPLKLNGKIYFGIDSSADNRIIPIDDSLIPVKPAWEAVHMNCDKIRRCCIPSFNGIGSAQGIAEFYSQLRGKLVSNETFDFVSGKLFRDANDPVQEHLWTKFALGVVLPGPVENRRLFVGHGGAVGSEGFYMPSEDIALGFVKNRLSPRHPDHPIRDRISRALGIPTRFW